jgi:hypothetical protein
VRTAGVRTAGVRARTRHGPDESGPQVVSPQPIGDVGQAGRAARVREHLVPLLDVGEAIVEQGEHVRGDLFAESVAGAEILVDPDLHVVVTSRVRGKWTAVTLTRERPDSELPGRISRRTGSAVDRCLRPPG